MDFGHDKSAERMNARIQFDQASKDLLAAARLIERHGYRAAGMAHPLNAVARITRPGDIASNSAGAVRYYAAAERLHAVLGFDNLDLSIEEAIDGLVAAAFWDV